MSSNDRNQPTTPSAKRVMTAPTAQIDVESILRGMNRSTSRYAALLEAYDAGTPTEALEALEVLEACASS